MKDKNFHKTAGILFLVVGALHLIRAVMAWPLRVDTYDIGIWFSYLAGIFILWMSYWAFNLGRNNK
tara:strand:+ start:1424 stop:1621 length:198 start_codon:yes stop_codon:yes gene_type:complete